jgi:tRNA-specific 2-thiouridylase
LSAERVAVAMSGGVDSSLAAALLKEAGYDVFGVYMQLWSDPDLAPTLSDLEHTCQLLDIPLYQLDLEREFQRLVIDYFCEEYSRGRTPNPCVACNQYIKFDLLLDKALGMGAEYLASGHYARIEHSAEGYRLLKAADQDKDQSYFLYTLGQRQLRRLLFPLGELSKERVKSLAAELGLPATSRSDSQDVCFIPDNDYRSFIKEHIPLKEGEIVDITGRVLGRHGGLAGYTVGQRHGLGLVLNQQLYVLRLEAAKNQLVVGTKEQLLQSGLVATELSWVSGKMPGERVNIMAKVRYKAPEVAAELHASDGRAEVRFTEPQSAIAPGQSVVFYQGDVVLGGGIIDAVLQ